MSKIKICGKDFEICCNTKALIELENKCEDISQLGEWLKTEKISVAASKYSEIIAILLNGAVYKRNSEISLGLADGEKSNFFTAENVLSLLNFSEIVSYKEAIFAELNRALSVDGVSAEIDPDLADCPSEKNG